MDQVSGYDRQYTVFFYMTTVQTLLEGEGEKSPKTILQGVEKTIFLERKCDTCSKHRKNHYIKAYTRERGGGVGV